MDSRDARHDLVRMTQDERIEYFIERTHKMNTFVRGVCSDGKHVNTARALGYARDWHKGRTRKSGEPYIIHPLTLACDAVGMGLNDDTLLAMLLLHDIPEDEGVLVMDLPVDDETKRAVECMTIRKMSGETKLRTKERYYNNLITNRYSIIGKGFDRRHNLSTMAKDMGKASIVKNCFETWFYLIPLLKDAKLKWPEYSNQIHTLRTDLTGYVNTLSVLVNIDLSYKNKPNDDLMNQILSAEEEEDLAKIPEIFITT